MADRVDAPSAAAYATSEFALVAMTAEEMDELDIELSRSSDAHI